MLNFLLNMRTSAWIMLLGLLITALSSTAASAHERLPDLGSPGLVIYDRQTEIELGRAFTHSLFSQYNLVDDPQVLSFVQRIGYRLAGHAHDGRNYRFYIIDNPSINAFAGPNGIIGIHTGLIMAVETEDELASVIAHEIAHVTQEHLARRFEQHSTYSMASFASLLAALLIGTQDPSAGMATLMGGAGLSIQNQLKHSRIHEHEADNKGIILLHKAGYDPSAMADFFGKLAKQHQHHGIRPPEILLTHPVTETRLAQAANRAQNLPQREEVHDPVNIKLIQQRLHHLNNTSGHRPHNELEQVALCYRLNLNPNHQDDTCLEQALTQHANNRLIKTLQAERLFRQDPGAALAKLKALQQIYPQDEAILHLYAQKLFVHGQYDLAQQLLAERTPPMRYQFGLYQLLSRSYAQQNKLAEAYLYEALAYIDIQQINRASHLIKRSVEAPPSENPTLQKQIQQLNEQLNNK